MGQRPKASLADRLAAAAREMVDEELRVTTIQTEAMVVPDCEAGRVPLIVLSRLSQRERAIGRMMMNCFDRFWGKLPELQVKPKVVVTTQRRAVQAARKSPPADPQPSPAGFSALVQRLNDETVWVSEG